MGNFVNRTQGHFTVIENEFLNDPLIYFKEKGLYAFLASKPPGWRFSALRISKQTREGRKAVLNSLKALESYGLLSRKKLKSGELEYILHLPSEKLINKPESQKGTLARCHNGTVQKQDSISNKEDSVKLNGESNSEASLSQSSKKSKYHRIAVDIESYFGGKIINSKDELLSWVRFLERNQMDDEKIINMVFDKIEDKCPSQKAFKVSYEKYKKLVYETKKLAPQKQIKEEKEITTEDLARLKDYGISLEREAK